MTDRSDNSEIRTMNALMLDVSEKRDIRAYETVFRYFAPRVKGYLGRFTQDANQAEELMQETMITVWNKAPLFDPARGALSTWIFAIARNRRIDALRRDRRPEIDPDDPALAADAEPDPELVLSRQQEARLLRDEISRLSVEQVTLLELAFFSDYSHTAIAKRLNMPLGTVKSRLRLAFGRLRGVLDRQERQPLDGATGKGVAQNLSDKVADPLPVAGVSSKMQTANDPSPDRKDRA